MKKTFLSVICLTMLSLLLISCDIDPYAGKRPYDYKHSSWLYKGDNYTICLESDDSETDSATKNSIIKIGDKEIKFTTLWSAFDSDVIFYEYDENGTRGEKLLKGTCEFGKNNFRISVTEKNEKLKDLPDVLCFDRLDKKSN